MVSIFPIFDNVDWYAVSVTFILVSTALLAFVEVWIATRKVEVMKDPNFIVGFVQGAFGYLVYHAAMHISWYVPFNPPAPRSTAILLAAPFTIMAATNIYADVADETIGRKGRRFTAGALLLCMVVTWYFVLANS